MNSFRFVLLMAVSFLLMIFCHQHIHAQHIHAFPPSEDSNKSKQSEYRTDPVLPEVRAVMKYDYEASRGFFMGKAAVLLNGKWGFVDTEGNEIVSPEFDFVCDYWASSTMGKKGKLWILIDENGRVIREFDIDFFDGFRNGKAKVLKNGRKAFIDVSGHFLAPGWVRDGDSRQSVSSRPANNLNIGCPSNIDFEFGDYRGWNSYQGRVGCNSGASNYLYNMNPVFPPVTDHIVLIDNSSTVSYDYYGGFPVSPPDGSLFAVKLGNDNSEVGADRPDARSESIEYNFRVPSASTNFNIIYDYAVVLEEPQNADTRHDYCERPRLTVTIKDSLTNEIIPCGFVEYVADSTSIINGGFIKSNIAVRNSFPADAWYKPWTTVFVNFSRYSNKPMKIIFSTTDCTLSGHWGYAYVDVRGCEIALKAYNTCRNPSQTVLDGPPGFGIYKWHDSNYSNLLSTSRYAILNSQLPLGSAVHLIYALNNQSACIDTLHCEVTNNIFNWGGGPDKSMCRGESVRIGSPPAPNILYSWSPSAHLSATDQAQVIASPLNDFRYIVTATDTITGCVLVDTVFVRMDPKPTLHVNDLRLCLGQEGDLVATGASEYFWTPHSTLFVNNRNNSTATIRPVSTGHFSYYVKGNANASGCYGLDTADVIVYPKPSAAINGPSSSNICQGQTVQLQAPIVFGSSLQWYYDNDTSDPTPPIIIAGANLSNLDVVNTGSYYVTYTNSLGCSDTASHPIQITTVPLPVPDFTYPSFCEDKPVSFTNTSDIPGPLQVSYQWNFGDGSALTDLTHPTHTFSPAGNYVVTLSVTPDLCPSLIQTSSQVVMIESPAPGIRYPDVYTVRNSNRPLQARPFAVSYLWEPSTGLSDPHISNPLFNYNTDMKYLIFLNSASSCETVDTQYVFIRNGVNIQVPTAFTPNGDGHNDVLDIFLTDIKRLKWFRVFNRWGQLLFETNDPRRLWDGTFKGVKQPAETYVWIAEGEAFDGSVILRRGQSVLLR